MDKRFELTIQGLPWLRICCSQHFSQMDKNGSQMKLTSAKVLVRKYQTVVLYLTLCTLAVIC